MLLGEEEAAREPPIPMVLVSGPGEGETEDGGGPRLEALTFLEPSPFSAWSDRPVMKRGPEYESRKLEMARRMIGIIARVEPELPGLVTEIYASTPLTAEWYTKSEGGGAFGISHDVGQQWIERPQTRVFFKNLFFTGHSITMPGICGVFINAFDTCDMIRGGDLFGAVARKDLP